MRQIGRHRWVVSVGGWTVSVCRGPSGLWYWNVTHPTAGQIGAGDEAKFSRALHEGRRFLGDLQEAADWWDSIPTRRPSRNDPGPQPTFKPMKFVRAAEAA